MANLAAGRHFFWRADDGCYTFCKVGSDSDNQGRGNIPAQIFITVPALLREAISHREVLDHSHKSPTFLEDVRSAAEDRSTLSDPALKWTLLLRNTQDESLESLEIPSSFCEYL